MKIPLLLFLTGFTLFVFCQNDNEMALINDKDGFTFLRLSPYQNSEIVDTIFSYEFFQVNTKTENGWSKAHNRWGKSGYIHRSRVKALSTLSDAQQKVLIDSIFILEPLYFTKKLIWKNDSTGNKNFHEENFEAILGLFIQYQIKSFDKKLMKAFLNILIMETGSADESPWNALGLIYNQHPNKTLNLINEFDNKVLNENLAYIQAVPHPTESILTKIFGKGNVFGRSALHKSSGGFLNDTLYFRISFSRKVFIDSALIYLIKTRASDSYLHGHEMGAENWYFLDTALNVVYRQESENSYPIGNETAHKIIQIGKNKFGLLTTFASDGNHHIESSVSISELTLDGFKHLIRFDTYYSNEAFINMTPDSLEPCMRDNMSLSYEFIKSNKLYFDINTTKLEDEWTQGCAEEIKKKTNTTYIYNNGKYILQ